MFEERVIQRCVRQCLLGYVALSTICAGEAFEEAKPKLLAGTISRQHNKDKREIGSARFVKAPPHQKRFNQDDGRNG
jgi:hypothetical protein